MSYFDGKELPILMIEDFDLEVSRLVTDQDFAQLQPYSFFNFLTQSVDEVRYFTLLVVGLSTSSVLFN